MSKLPVAPSRCFACLLLASVTSPAWAGQQGSSSVNPAQNEIVVTGTRERRAVVEGIDAERSIDGDAIAAYGAGSIGEVLAEIAREEGEGGEEPLLFVNGVPIADSGDIVDYPAEAVERLDVLPRGAGARLGGGANRRAYNVVLRRSFASTIGTVADRFATGGGWNALSGELTFTRIAGQQRLNITARVADESLLRESERGLLQPDPSYAYDVIGNVVPVPGSGLVEIDPALSALTGTVVTIAALPANRTAPTLAQLVGGANSANVTDLGYYRSLRPATRRYALGLTVNQPVTDWLSAVLTARWEREEFDSLQGLRAGLFVLPASDPHSPFSRDVAIARYLDGEPLRYATTYDRANIDLTLNSQRGEWLLSLRGGWRLYALDTAGDRQDRSPTQPLVLASTDDPFAGDISGLLPVSRETSRSTTNTAHAQFLASGPVVALPAGQLRAALTASWTQLHQQGRTRSRFFDTDRSVERTEWLGSLSLEVPLLSPEMAGIGAVTGEVDYAATHIPSLGEIERYGFGLRWEPVTRFSLRAGQNTEGRLPDPAQLGDPRSETENIRYFDPLRQQTVDVTQVSGGNSALFDQRLRTLLFSTTYEAWQAMGLRLVADYTRTNLDKPISYLPPSSTDILTAFPERFLRDGDGTLVSVDVRPVNFVERSTERLRFEASFLVLLSASLRPDAEGNVPPLVPGQARWRLQGTASYTLELNDRITLREGQPALDLLDGGAIGFGGVTSRHRVDASFSLSDRELGFRLASSWRSAARLNAGMPADPSQLRFGSLATFDLRAFTDLGQVFPQARPLAKTRVTLALANVLNSRQRVVDELGEIPLRYQPGQRDPLGRILEIELRRQF